MLSENEVSGVSAAAGRGAVSQIEKETFLMKFHASVQVSGFCDASS
jgi:hypothetical protein